MDVELPENVSLTFYLMASGKKDRIKTSVWIERVYYEVLKKEGICVSDIVNFLLEQYLKKKGLIDVSEILKSLRGRRDL